MAIENYYVGDLNAIGAQMGQDRALSAQERIARAQATAEAIRSLGLQRSRNQDSAAARAEQRYSTDADMALRRELAKATLGQSADARAELARQFNETQRSASDRLGVADQLKRDELKNLLAIAETESKARYGGFPTQAFAPQIRAQQDVDEWNTTAKALEANLNTRLEFLDAQEAKDTETEADKWFTNTPAARRIAAEKRAAAEKALFEGLEGAADYVLPVVDPITGRRRFKANLRTPPPMPNFGPQPLPTPAAVQLQSAAPVVADPLAALAAVTAPRPNRAMMEGSVPVPALAQVTAPVAPTAVNRDPLGLAAWFHGQFGRTSPVAAAPVAGQEFRSADEARAAGIAPGQEFIIIQNGERWRARMR